MRAAPLILRALLALVGVAAVGACQNYPFQFRANERTAVTSSREVVVSSNDTDILFVIDDSGSMGEEQDNLIRNTAVFIGELAASDNLYRVGVVSTDAFDLANGGQNGGRLRMRRATQNELNNAGCGGIGPDNSGLPYLERPDLDDPQLDAKRCRLQQDFIETVRSLGTGGSGTEAGLLAAELALGRGGPGVTMANSGFVRPEADLAIIFMTDEEDCSQPDIDVLEDNFGTGNLRCYDALPDARPVVEFVSYFEQLKQSAAGIRSVRAASIAGGGFGGEGGADFLPQGCSLVSNQLTTDCGCWSSSNNDGFCDYLNGFGNPCTTTGNCMERCDALAGARYHDFIQELRQRRVSSGFPTGVFEDSICQPEYDQTLVQIVRTVVIDQCFDIAEPALSPELIEVTQFVADPTTGDFLNGTPLPRLDPSDPTAECSSCGDCPGGAWEIQPNETTICLTCGLRKQTGDAFTVTALTEANVAEPASP